MCTIYRDEQKSKLQFIHILKNTRPGPGGRGRPHIPQAVFSVWFLTVLLRDPGSLRRHVNAADNHFCGESEMDVQKHKVKSSFQDMFVSGVRMAMMSETDAI